MPFDNKGLLIRIENIRSARELRRKRIVNQIFDNGDLDSGFGRKDQKIFQVLNQVIEKHLFDSRYDIGTLASDLAMSERALQRKLKALTGISPVQYLRKYRLRKSLVYLREGMPVNQAAESVGFSSPTYFASRFKEEFGDSPTDFVSSSSQ